LRKNGVIGATLLLQLQAEAENISQPQQAKMKLDGGKLLRQKPTASNSQEEE
jgi:hypothetical protein